MKGVSLAYREVRIGDYPDPVPGPHDVVVRVRASAICRADLSLYHGRSVFNQAPTGAIIAGHEPAGVIEVVGAEVNGLAPGDRVAVYHAVGCGRCRFCTAGDQTHCGRWQCLGFDRHGGNADFLLVPASNCLPLPDDWSFSVAALSTDAIGTLYHAEKRLGVSGRDVLAIFGQGPMGLAGLMVAKGLGASVIGVDPVGHRRELARELGANWVVDPTATSVVGEIRRITGGFGASAVLDCSGNAQAINQGLDAAAVFGRFGVVGGCTEVSINPRDQLIRKQLTVVASWYFNLSEYGEIRDFIVRKQLPVERLITHRFPLDEARQAFELFDRHETGKVVFELD